MNKFARNGILTALVMLSLAACVSDGGTEGTGSSEAELVQADASGRELGFDHYELRGLDGPGVEITIIDQQADRFGTVTLRRRGGDSYTALQLRDQAERAEVIQGGSGFVLMLDGAEVARAESWQMVARSVDLLRAAPFLDVLHALETDRNFKRAMANRRADEQNTEEEGLCMEEPVPVEPPTTDYDAGTEPLPEEPPAMDYDAGAEPPPADPFTPDYSDAGVPGAEEQAMQCGYWKCVWLVLKCEAAIVAAPAVVAACGATCITAGVWTGGAACAACIAALPAGLIASGDAIMSWCGDACKNGCIPGC